MIYWRLLAKAIGDKAGNTDKEADVVAIIRLLLILLTVATEVAIISGIIKHW